MLPWEKLAKLEGLLMQACKRRSLTLKEWQVLLGHLTFACKVVAPWHVFTRRICNCPKSTCQPHHRIRVTGGIRACGWSSFRMLMGYLSGDNQLVWRPHFRSLLTHQVVRVLGCSFRDAGVLSLGCRIGTILAYTFLEFFPLLVTVHR